MAAVNGIFKLLDAEEQVIVPANAVKLAPARGAIEFDHVWFAYKDQEFVLKTCSFQVSPDRRWLLSAPRGRAKPLSSTSITRMYNQPGTIRLDGQIFAGNAYELRRRIGSGFSRTSFIFSRHHPGEHTLGIKTYRSRRLSRPANVNGPSFIMQYREQKSQAHRTRQQLSVGQKHCSLCAGTAYNPPILLLDEATSSIDTETSC